MQSYMYLICILHISYFKFTAFCFNHKVPIHFNTIVLSYTFFFNSRFPSEIQAMIKYDNILSRHELVLSKKPVQENMFVINF